MSKHEEFPIAPDEGEGAEDLEVLIEDIEDEDLDEDDEDDLEEVDDPAIDALFEKGL